jgi:hypothetical protein
MKPFDLNIQTKLQKNNLIHLLLLTLTISLTLQKLNLNTNIFNDISECKHSSITPASPLGTCGSNTNTDFKEMQSFFCQNFFASTKKFLLRVELKLPFDESYYSASATKEIFFTFQLSKNPEILVIVYHHIPSTLFCYENN